MIAITNLKLFESLPAPHIFVDPFGLGKGGAHLWEEAISQFKTVAADKQVEGRPVRLAPSWVPRFCHMVRTYEESLAIIKDFVKDPVAYWRTTGIPDTDLCTAYRNVQAAGVTIPFYIAEAMQKIIQCR